MDNMQVRPDAEWVLQPVRDGEWCNVAESNAALLATARGGKIRRFLDWRPEAAPVTVAAEGNLPLVMPQGNLVQVLGCEVKRQGN